MKIVIITLQQTITQNVGVQPMFCIAFEEFTYDYAPRKLSLGVFNSQTWK